MGLFDSFNTSFLLLLFFLEAMLSQALGSVSIKEPRIPVFSNVTAEPFKDVAAIPGMLARQLVEPVKWENILSSLAKLGKNQVYELGPGSQLKAMMKRVDLYVWKAMQNVSA